MIWVTTLYGEETDATYVYETERPSVAHMEHERLFHAGMELVQERAVPGRFDIMLTSDDFTARLNFPSALEY